MDDADRRELVLLSISVAIGDALDSIPMTEEVRDGCWCWSSER